MATTFRALRPEAAGMHASVARLNIYVNTSMFQYTIYKYTYLYTHLPPCIDIYVDMNFRQEAIAALSKNGFNILEGDFPNISNHFLQLIIERENILTYVDFYFFDNSNENYISDKWNFTGKINRSAHEMHVPKDLIYPIKSYNYKNKKISIPANIGKLCIFLYGEKWSQPLQKRTQYSTVIINHKPKILTGWFGRIFCSIIELYRRTQD